MTTHPGVKTRTPLTPQQLADCARVLELLLPPGMSIAHTRQRWYVKRFDSWVQHSQTPRMGWRDVDSDKDLSSLLGRLREGPRE